MHNVVVMEVAHAPVILLLMITQKTETARQLTMTTLTTNKGSRKTRPNSWAKQVHEIEWRHWTLDFMIFRYMR